MIQLSTFLWVMIAMFAVVGFLRGWTKEIVATAGIILALFALWQFQAILLEQLTQSASQDQKFYFYTIPFILITFFAYQTPGTAARLSEGRMWSNRREGLQERLLGPGRHLVQHRSHDVLSDARLAENQDRRREGRGTQDCIAQFVHDGIAENDGASSQLDVLVAAK